MTKTQWFPAYVNPIRKGWYEVKGCNACCVTHRWNGKQWGKPGFPFAFDPLPWRGLTEQTK